jgi:tetratricopeptide (TPR) repeat protein
MGFFDGLYPYEVILLVLGACFFVVLVVLLAVLVAKGRPYGKMAGFFVFPLIMMGFPGLKSVQFKDGVVSIERLTHDLQQNPADGAKRAELNQKLNELANRPAADPAAIASIGSAQFALGEHRAAEETLQKAIAKAPQLPQVQELKKRIDIDNSLKNLTAKVEQNPADHSAKLQLEKTVDEAARIHTASPELLANIAQAHEAAGNHSAAAVTADKVLKIAPHSLPAQRVRILTKQ